MHEGRPRRRVAATMPRCLATIPSRIRNRTTAPSATPSRGTRCRRRRRPQPLLARRLGPVRRIGRRRLGLGAQMLAPDAADQPQAIRPGAPAPRPDAHRACRSSPAPAPTIPAPRHPPPPVRLPPSLHRLVRRHRHHPVLARVSPETRDNSAGCRTSAGRSRPACRSPPPAGSRRRRRRLARNGSHNSIRRPSAVSRSFLITPARPAAAPVSTRSRPRSNQRSSKPSSAAKTNTLPSVDALHRHVREIPRIAQVDGAARIAQHRRAGRLVDPALRLVQRLAPDPAIRPGTPPPARVTSPSVPRNCITRLADIRPVHQPGRHLGAVIAPGARYPPRDRLRRQRRPCASVLSTASPVDCCNAAAVSPVSALKITPLEARSRS